MNYSSCGNLIHRGTTGSVSALGTDTIDDTEVYKSGRLHWDGVFITNTAFQDTHIWGYLANSLENIGYVIDTEINKAHYSSKFL
jgi:hypothetical protein